MKNKRQDAWTKDEDLYLAEKVLRYIREGKTQLEAFQEVAIELNRTPAACGFRWNATIRKDYLEAVELAKNSRNNTSIPNEVNTTDLSQLINLLENMKSYYEERETYLTEPIERIQLLEQENQAIKEKCEKILHLVNEYKSLTKKLELITKDLSLN